MIKNIFYLFTIIAAGAATYFSVDAKKKLTGVYDGTVETYNTNQDLNKKIEKREGERDTAIAQRKEAENVLSEHQSSLENEQSKEKGLKTDLAKLETESEKLDGELAKIDEGIAEAERLLREMLPDENINGLDVEGVVAKVEQLEEERKQKEEKLEEETLISEKLASDVASAEGRKGNLQGNLGDVKRRVSLNSVTATVSAVSNEYGFVIINKGADNSNINEQTKLLVSRGDKFIGRLKVDQVEPTRTICDIDSGSTKNGVRVRPGDRVTLEKSVVN